MGRATMIKLDLKALRGAAEVLGTDTKEETVNEALRRVAEMRSYRRMLEALERSDLNNPEVMRGAWRQ